MRRRDGSDRLRLRGSPVEELLDGPGASRRVGVGDGQEGVSIVTGRQVDVTDEVTVSPTIPNTVLSPGVLPVLTEER